MAGRKGINMFERMNERIKKLTVVDITLTKWSVLFATIIIVKLLPRLTDISYPVLIALMLACAARPIYLMWFKK